MCNCRVCTYGREVQEQLAKLPDEQRTFFEDMYDRLIGEEDQSNYYQAIVDGSWPQSEEILARYRSS